MTLQKADNIEIFEKMPIGRAVRTMAIPTVISQLIVLIYSIADTLFIGRTNNPYMVAGASLILPVFNIAVPLAGLAGVGGGALVSRLLGQKREDEVKKVYSFCVYLSGLIAALFSLGVLIFMRPLMGLLGATEQTRGFAMSYSFCVIVCGGIPTVLSNTFANLLRSVGESKRAGLGITLGGIINIILDPIFMFVLMPDGMEIVGAGVATCLSNFITCGYFIALLIRLKKAGSPLALCSPLQLPEKRSLLSIFAVGVPSALTTLLFDLDYIVIDRLMSGHNDIALAAVGIVLKVERLPLNIGVGICHGMMPIIAYTYSTKNYERMKGVKRYALRLGLICAAVSIVLYELFAGQIMRIFISDAQTVMLGTRFLRIRVLATPLMFLSFFHVYLFSGLGEGRYSLLLGVSRWLVLNIPMLYILNYFIGMYGLVISQSAADFLTVILSVIVYRFYSKRHKLT